jgi:hypothetical protein
MSFAKMPKPSRWDFLLLLLFLAFLSFFQVPSGLHVVTGNHGQFAASRIKTAIRAGLNLFAYGAFPDLTDVFTVRRFAAKSLAAKAVNHARSDLHAVQLAPFLGDKLLHFFVFGKCSVIGFAFGTVQSAKGCYIFHKLFLFIL